ncbi:hypothetical protein GCM10009422_21780 [Brevundimonas kwangchunensis]|uniref:Uncharacterized protein n=1 Tax=Brevundimonas kwangchunensis TaxID=322163 RepID=A0ABN1GZX1_9CAUL
MQLGIRSREALLGRLKIGALAGFIPLSAGLLLPPVYAGPIMTAMLVIAALAFAGKGTLPHYDVSSVPADARRRFLVESSCWMLAALVSYGVVFALLFIAAPFSTKAGFGHLALIAATISWIMFIRSSERHLKLAGSNASR